MRIESLLDAAAAAVAAGGLADASVQKIARRAGASIGSMYHFFPTREAIFDALRDRYRAEFREVIAPHLARTAVDWASLPLDDCIDEFFSPIAGYLARRPAWLLINDPADRARRPEDAAIDRDVRTLFTSILRARAPHAPRAAIELRAATVFAMGDGVFAAVRKAPRARAMPLFDELKRAVISYLRSHEGANGVR
ncbi:MAG: TetR/AcrR family transcriptional regulator [Gemmatimonadaceae bacterium]